MGGRASTPVDALAGQEDPPNPAAKPGPAHGRMGRAERRAKWHALSRVAQKTLKGKKAPPARARVALSAQRPARSAPHIMWTMRVCGTRMGVGASKRAAATPVCSTCWKRLEEHGKVVAKVVVTCARQNGTASEAGNGDTRADP